MMTPEHLERMQQARADAAQRRMRREDDQLIDWQRWLREDARRFSALRAAAAAGDSDETREARERWQEHARREPPRPPDAAFKRARGESSE